MPGMNVELYRKTAFQIMGRRVKSQLFNIWQYTSCIILSLLDKSVRLHLTKRMEIQKDWPGDLREVQVCIASLTVSLDDVKFSGASKKGAYATHPKYEFFRDIIDGFPPEEHPYFLSYNFKTELEAKSFLNRKLEILRVAIAGENSFEIVGNFWVDGSLRIRDGEHRMLALAALGKRRMRLAIGLEI